MTTNFFNKDINKIISTTNSDFISSLKNAYGSKHNFEHELIKKAYQQGNKGKIYFCVNNYLNFSVSKDSNENEYTLLTCNLDICDIYNFIEDIDYSRLSNAYMKVRSLIESK